MADKQKFENQTGDFEGDAGRQAEDGLGKQSLKVASGVLELVKNAFDPLTQTA